MVHKFTKKEKLQLRTDTFFKKYKRRGLYKTVDEFIKDDPEGAKWLVDHPDLKR